METKSFTATAIATCIN